MKIFSRFTPPLVLFGLFITTSAAHADTIWSWSFDQTEYLVEPSDMILIRATLFNDRASTGSLIREAGGFFGGDIQKTYKFTFWSELPEFNDQFDGLDVEPGASFPFVLGLYSPIGGAAPPGFRASCCDGVTNGALLFFEPSDGPPTGEVPSNGFSIQVAPLPEPVPIPEPSSLVLLSAGALSLFFRPRINR